MRIVNEVKLDFDDVLIQPHRSETASRSHVRLTKNYIFKNGVKWEGVPIIAANMSAIGTFAMAKEMAEQEMMTCLHKYYPVNELVDFLKDNTNVFYTLGIGSDELEKYKMVCSKVSFPFVCVDVANGYTEVFVDHLKRVREINPRAVIMAGNVATPEMVQELLISEAADIVKIGIGSGSVCTTRLVAGVGYPQLSAIIECADAAHGLGGHICSDGGCVNPCDIVKAFGAGADFVMLGGILSGHDECEGEWDYDSKGKEKESFTFFGMASEEAANQYCGGLKGYRASEGKCVSVPYKGPVSDTLQQITGGLRSACAYTGARSLKDLPKCTTFIRVSRTHNTSFE